MRRSRVRWILAAALVIVGSAPVAVLFVVHRDRGTFRPRLRQWYVAGRSASADFAMENRTGETVLVRLNQASTPTYEVQFWTDDAWEVDPSLSNCGPSPFDFQWLEIGPGDGIVFRVFLRDETRPFRVALQLRNSTSSTPYAVWSDRVQRP